MKVSIKKLHWFLTFLFLGCGVLSLYAAETSQVIPYGSSLPGRGGTTQSLIFKIYNNPNGTGAPVFEDQPQSVVIASDDSFLANVGDGTAGGIPTVIFINNPSLYITFALASDPNTNLAVLIPINSSGFSHTAQTAASAETAVSAQTANTAQTATSAQTAVTAQTANTAQTAATLSPGASVSGSLPGAILILTNTAPSGVTIGVQGESLSPNGAGVLGINSADSGPAAGVHGTSGSPNGAGVWGINSADNGLALGVHGASGSSNGVGVFGLASADSGEAVGVGGESRSPDGTGVIGAATATSGQTKGVHGQSASPDGTGVVGIASADSGQTQGVRGQSSSPQGRGVLGFASATSGVTIGVQGQSSSPQSRGVFGFVDTASGPAYGVQGESRSPQGTGVFGIGTATSGQTTGVWGESSSPDGRGVFGFNSATSGLAFGVQGQSASSNGTGVSGFVDGTPTTGNTFGVRGVATATSGFAEGVRGETFSADGAAVVGVARATSGLAFGVAGQSISPDGHGVQGLSIGTNATGVDGIARNGPNAKGVWGSSIDGFAGYFSGKVHVTDMLTKGGGSFKIDHPLDPQNKYLYHSFVESPDMKNIYDGVALLDNNGEAVVTLPEWFEALNRDFRYQLTAIGAPGPNLHIAEKVSQNRFKIAGGYPGMEVSWQVTGIRQDAWAEAHRIAVEEDKPAPERGFYLHPLVFGAPEEKSIEWGRNPERMKRLREMRAK